jgi:excisionase family DNA binding protein
MEEKLLSIREIAENLGFSVDYVRSLVKKGKIKGLKVGHQYVVTQEELDNYLKTKNNALSKGGKSL